MLHQRTGVVKHVNQDKTRQQTRRVEEEKRLEAVTQQKTVRQRVRMARMENARLTHAKLKTAPSSEARGPARGPAPVTTEHQEGGGPRHPGPVLFFQTGMKQARRTTL